MIRTGLLTTFCALLAACAAGPHDCERQFAGTYVWGHEVHSFRPCDESATYWVSASGWVIAELQEHYESETERYYQPIYIQFRGQILNEVTDGFASDYDGLIRISEVLEWSPTVPSTCNRE